MTTRLCLLTLLSVTLFAAGAQAQGTYADTVSQDGRKQYSFTTSGAGQLIATLSWDSQPADLFMILVCSPVGSTSEPLTFGVGAGQLDRTARLEAGLIGRSTCVLGVSTFDDPAAFRLNLQLTSSQSASPLAFVASSSRDAALESRLIQHAATVMRSLESSR